MKNAEGQALRRFHLSKNLARARAQRRASGERARAHTHAWTDGRGNGLEGAAAARADFEAGVRAGKMSAEPMSAS